LLDGYFGVEADAASLDATSPAELATAVDTTDCRRMVDLLVVLEFCRHGDGEAQADRVEEYVRALGADQPLPASTSRSTAFAATAASRRVARRSSDHVPSARRDHAPGCETRVRCRRRVDRRR
jgi:hypothetical protein